MPNTPHRNPHYTLYIRETTMDELEYIVGHNGRSTNREIEQLTLAHIASYGRVRDPVILAEEDYDFIHRRTNR